MFSLVISICPQLHITEHFVMECAHYQFIVTVKIFNLEFLGASVTPTTVSTEEDKFNSSESKADNLA